MRTTPTLYSEVLAIIRSSAHAVDAEGALRRIQELGFNEVAATDHKFERGYIRNDGYNSVYVQYRYYDTSKAFSIQPDMNVFLVKHLSNVSVLEHEEVRFLDN